MKICRKLSYYGWGKWDILRPGERATTEGTWKWKLETIYACHAGLAKTPDYLRPRGQTYERPYGDSSDSR